MTGRAEQQAALDDVDYCLGEVRTAMAELQAALDDVDYCLGEVRTAMPAVWDRLSCVRDALDGAIQHG